MNAVADPKETLISLRDTRKRFVASRSFWGRPRSWVHAVDGVNLDIFEGETVGLVGESGCGKSTLGRVLLRLQEPTTGRIYFEGQDITTYDRVQMRPLRRRMQVIFQDPYGSLNPRMTVQGALAEAMRLHGLLPDTSKEEERVGMLLERVGLRPEMMRRYPHEFSGGQRQRVGIARALAVEPRFIVADEPISALDVSIQAQIINLLMDLQEELGLSYLFIAHDLQVVEFISHRIAVMYLGKIVEIGRAGDVYGDPRHPYTKALLSAVPVPDPKRLSSRILLQGDVPSPIDPPAGCAFHPRCAIAEKGLCDQQTPTLQDIGGKRQAACHKL